MVVRSVLAALVGLAIAGAGTAPAQEYPTKPVRIIVGFTAGGVTDQVARFLAEYMTRQTGQPAIVENRAGAAGTIAMDAVAKAAPDGYTLGVVLTGNLVINPFMQKNMPLDVMKDLVPVAAIGDSPLLISINPEIPAKTAQEFIALAKAKPGGYQYGSAGPGSIPHLGADVFARMAGIDLVHVPYRGGAQATADLIAGRVHLFSGSYSGIRPGHEAGKVRILLAAAKQRLPYLPDVPTSAEVGIPNYVLSLWLGVVAPRGTPQAVIDRVHALTEGMLKDPASLKRLEVLQVDPMSMTQPLFAQFVKDEYARWERIIREAGVQPQ